jgi:hypothetical protein
MGPSNAAVGTTSDIEVVADDKPTQNYIGKVLLSTDTQTDVQFGSEIMVDYLLDSHNMSIKLELGYIASTASFHTGNPFNTVAIQALHACGVEPTVSPTDSDLPPKEARPKDCSNIKPEERTLDCAWSPTQK